MNLFRKVMGGKTLPPVEEPDLEEEIRQMAKSEDAVAREDEKSGLVALYPELGASRRRRRRGFVDLDDLDDYVPELDDYEPGLEGEYLPPDELSGPARRMAGGADAARAVRRTDVHGGDGDGADPVPAPAPTYRLEHATQPEPGPEPTQDAWPPRQAAAPAPDDEDEEDEGAPQGLVRVPAPAVGRAGGRRAGRVKTRLLGFGQSGGGETDPFEAVQAAAATGTAR